MSHGAPEPVSAVVLNFNGMDSLGATLTSLQQYRPAFAEIIVVDDGSTDGSVEFVEREFPSVRVMPLGRNTANLATVRNTGIYAASSRYVFLTDNDIELEPGCIERLYETLTADDHTFSVTPRLLDQDNPSVIYQSGNGLHFLAVSTGSMRAVAVSEARSHAPWRSLGGGIMLLDMTKVRELGGFDPGYTLGWADDAELHYAGEISGYRSLHEPRALARVKVRAHGTKRAFGQYHNRLRFIFTGYSGLTLLLFGPALILFEVGVALSAIVSGSLPAYLRAWGRILSSGGELLRRRRLLQSRRKVSDLAILRHGTFEFPGQWKLNRFARRMVAAAQHCWDVFWWIAWPFLNVQSVRLGSRVR